ncbi:MAG: PQQ-binding-like beta-propeller repeat protein [Synergistaceae bacterium]|nr:PQQ-binding-like beta-propeller repeat protein [Synergistaceae bacterium]
MKRTALKVSAALLVMAFCVSSASAWSGRQGWTYDAGYPITSSVAVADGLVIAGDSVGNLHAVHMASGQPAWSYKGSYSVVGLPAVSGGMVVFAQGDGTITALSLSNGSALWTRSPQIEGPAETLTDGVAVGDGRVFFAQGDGKLCALSASDGRLLWRYDSEMELRSAPRASDGLVFVGEYQGIFTVLNPQTGKRVWGGGAGGAINTPATHAGHVYFSSWDGSVQSVLIRGVVPQWNTKVGDPVTTPPSVEGDRVFVGTANGQVVALSRAKGEVLWRFDTRGGTVAGTPVAAEGLVFVAGGQGTLFVLDAASGALRFNFETGNVISGTPAYSGGILFLGSEDGKIYAIR